MHVIHYFFLCSSAHRLLVLAVLTLSISLEVPLIQEPKDVHVHLKEKTKDYKHVMYLKGIETKNRFLDTH